MAAAAVEGQKRRESARRAELEAQGRKPRRPPTGRDPFKPKPGAQRRLPDPRSRGLARVRTISADNC